MGGVFINRGVEKLIDATKILAGYNLALVGSVDPEYKALLILQARSLQVESRVHFVPPVPPEQVVSYIATADVGVFAIKNICKSYDFCMPNKLFEMSFSNIPIAVSKLTSINRFIGEVGNGLMFDPEDPVDIASKIKTVYENPTQFVANKEALKPYSWESQKKKLYLIYQELGIFPI